MQTKEQTELAEIGEAYSTAIIWVSRDRYTYATTDGKFTGHCSEPNAKKFRRALSLEVFCLHQKGYFTRIKHTNIEG